MALGTGHTGCKRRFLIGEMASETALVGLSTIESDEDNLQAANARLAQSGPSGNPLDRFACMEHIPSYT